MPTESLVRRLARRHGYVLRKSRSSISLDNFGEYMLIHAQRNAVALGSRFDATLDDVAEWLKGE